MSDLVVPATPSLEGPINTHAVIVGLETRDVTFDGEESTYVDFSLKVEHEELSKILGNSPIRVGFPLRLSPDTLLGQFVKRFKLDPSEEVNLTKEFVGRRVQVMCDKEESKGGGLYWRIDRNAILPAAQNPQTNLPAS